MFYSITRDSPRKYGLLKNIEYIRVSDECPFVIFFLIILAYFLVIFEGCAWNVAWAMPQESFLSVWLTDVELNHVVNIPSLIFRYRKCM